MTSDTAATRRLDGVHVNRWGSGSPVLLIHGGGHGDPAGGSQAWKFQRPLAEQGWTLVMPDRPGMGQSPSQGPDDLEADAPWVAEMLGEGAHLIGHSYGGAIALCAAGIRPHAVRSLTLVEAPVFSIAANRPEVQAQVAQIHEAMASRIALVGMVKSLKALGIPRDRELRERPPLAAIARMAQGFKSMRPPDSWNAEPAITAIRGAGVPVLYVEGGWSPGFRAVGEEVTGLTGGELLRIPAGHHFPHMFEQGQQFNAAWQQFASPVTGVGR
jgi:pimeloyl-ACP methyl ester carboxylesterase